MLPSFTLCLQHASSKHPYIRSKHHPLLYNLHTPFFTTHTSPTLIKMAAPSETCDDYVQNHLTPSEPSNDLHCPICFEDWEPENKEIVSLHCGHIFHKDCIVTWLTSAGSGATNCCTNCRSVCFPGPDSDADDTDADSDSEDFSDSDDYYDPELDAALAAAVQRHRLPNRGRAVSGSVVNGVGGRVVNGVGGRVVNGVSGRAVSSVSGRVMLRPVSRLANLPASVEDSDADGEFGELDFEENAVEQRQRSAGRGTAMLRAAGRGLAMLRATTRGHATPVLGLRHPTARRVVVVISASDSESDSGSDSDDEPDSDDESDSYIDDGNGSD
jgi:hypothetical protein